MDSPIQFTMPRNLKEIDTYSICKIEILDENDVPIHEIKQNDIVSVDTQYTNQNGTRRTGTLTLANENDKYTPRYRGLIWLNTRLKISSGNVVNGKEVLYSRGIYMILNSNIDDNLSLPTITFSLSDKYALLDGSLAGTLPNDVIIEREIPISTAIRSILSSTSDKKSPLITNTDVKTFYTLTVEAGGSVDDLIKPLAETMSYQYGYDINGIFVFHPEVVSSTMEYSNNASVYDFAKEDVNLFSTSNIQDFTKIKNNIIVIGENVLGNLVRAEISDNYIFSTTRKELIEERVKVVYDKNISTQELANIRAAYELFVSIRLQEQIEITCSVIDYIKENDIISIQNSMSGIPERFLVNSVSYNSNSSTMSMSVWKIRNAI